MRRFALSLIGAGLLLAPLLAATSDAATSNATSILTQTLADAAPQTSVTVAGRFTGGGVTVTTSLGIDANAQGGPTTFAPLGSEDLILPNVGKYFYVKGGSLGILHEILDVKAPTASEIGVWYKVTSSDPRYNTINPPGGAQNIKQMFSYSPVGFSRAVTYGGTSVVKGVKVIKLVTASNMWVNKGFGRVILYVTDENRPMPFAISAPAGTKGLLYFSKWGTTKVVLPTSNIALPQ